MKFAIRPFVVGGMLALASACDPASAQSEAPATPDTTNADMATVRVTVENVQSDSGAVWVALCTTSLSVEGCPYQEKTAASVGTAEVVFTDITPGIYAVAGYHDVNGNGLFDKLLGVPREPYALSGAAGDELVPTFKDAALEIKPGENDITIRLKRLGG